MQWVWAVAALLGGCSFPDLVHHDARTDAGADAADSTIDAPPAHVRAVVAATDFSTGTLSVLDVTTGMMMTNVAPADAVGGDPVLRKVGDELFIVNRDAGKNITIIDADTFAFVEKLGTGDGSNPQDVAVVGNKLYVPTYGNKGAVVLTRGQSGATYLDFSAADPDGKPNCSSAYYAGGKVFIACNLLDDANSMPRGPAKVFVIDPSNDSVTDTLTLATKNPFSLFEQVSHDALAHADELLIGTIEFSTQAGCIERIIANGIPSTAGCLVNNTMVAPGYVGRFSLDGSTALVSVLNFPSGLVRRLDLTTGTLGASLTTQQASDVAVCPSGQFVTADPSATGGLRVYEADGTEITAMAYDAGKTVKATHGLVCY